MTSAVAITGIGALSAAGDQLAALTAALIAGRSGLSVVEDPALPLAALLPVGAVRLALPAHEPRTVDATWRKVGDLLDLFTPQECANYFTNSGYASV